MKINKKIRGATIALISSVLVNLGGGLTQPTIAAQTIVLKKGIFEMSVPVQDLRTLVNTGKLSDRLQAYANFLSPQQRTLIYGALKAKIKLNPLSWSNVLYSRVGENILADLATVTPRRDGAMLNALRGALVLGALPNDGLSILSFIENYPGERIIIDVDQAFKIMKGLNNSFWQTQRFMQAIAPQLSTKLPNINIPFDASKAGPNQVQMSTLDLYDSKRDRKIPVDIYWSNAATQNKPLIVFSHGLGSVRSDLQYLAQHLASHGYVVAALEHPGSNEANTNAALTGTKSLLKAQEFVERPKDISFILDELTKVNQNNASLQGKLGTNNAMVIGYSFGGSTALSLSGAELQPHWMSKRCKEDVISFSLGEGIQCISAALPEDKYQLREPRIKSAIVLNPVASLMFGDTGISKVEIPTLILGGSADKTTPSLTEQVIPFTKITTPKWLLGVVGGTHLSVKDPSKTMDQKGKPNTPITGEEVVGEKAVAVREYIKAVSLAMAAQMTPDAEKYAIFLSPEYGQLASKDGFQFLMLRDLPPEAKAVVDSFIKEN